LKAGGKYEVQKNRILIKRYMPKNIASEYLGLYPAKIHAIRAGTSMIKTKFLRSSISAK
jgi:hypothetical protein